MREQIENQENDIGALQDIIHSMKQLKKLAIEGWSWPDSFVLDLNEASHSLPWHLYTHIKKDHADDGLRSPCQP